MLKKSRIYKFKKMGTCSSFDSPEHVNSTTNWDLIKIKLCEISTRRILVDSFYAFSFFCRIVPKILNRDFFKLEWET